jgi:squalene synthase HpnC
MLHHHIAFPFACHPEPSVSAVTAPLKAAAPTAAEAMPWLALVIPARARRQVVAFYRFAVRADDIADAPDLGAEEKLQRLDAMERGLAGGNGDRVANALYAAVGGNDLLLDHGRQLLQAFRRDAVCDHCRDWADLMTYCRFSAVPVGRFLLDILDEEPEAAPAIDALCAALQILNHLQDCGIDYRRLGRVYLPRDRLLQADVDVELLAGAQSSPDLRHIFDDILDGVDGLIHLARPLPDRLRGFRHRAEAAATIEWAQRLSHRLRVSDPLFQPVRPGAGDYLASVAAAMCACFRKE